MRLHIGLCTFVESCTGCNIHLAADYCLYAVFNAFVIEVDTAVHYAVIGQCYGCLSHFLCMTDKPSYTAGAVKKAVFTMNVQMYKTAHFYSPRLSSPLSVSAIRLIFLSL